MAWAHPVADGLPTASLGQRCLCRAPSGLSINRVLDLKLTRRQTSALKNFGVLTHRG
jgi:hypothetical protein